MNVIHNYLIFIKTLWSEKMLGLFFSREKKMFTIALRLKDTFLTRTSPSI